MNIISSYYGDFQPLKHDNSFDAIFEHGGQPGTSQQIFEDFLAGPNSIQLTISYNAMKNA